MPDNDTAIKPGTASGAAADATASDSDKAGSESNQPANAGVDSGGAEEKGNSAQSDVGDGADGADGGRQRPGRAERKISELTKKVAELTKEREGRQNLASQLQKTPVDGSNVQLPDYSQMTEITPDQLKKDIINAATQIVDIRMQTTANVLDQKLNTRQAQTQSENAIRETISKFPILNPDSEDYDQEFDREITDAYSSVLAQDPTYTFDKFIKPMERFLEQSNTDKPTTSTRGTAANRAGAQSKNVKRFEDLKTTKEMEDWFAARRG